MAVPILDLSRQHGALADELRAAFNDVMDRSAFVLGPQVEAFEAKLAAYHGTKHAIGVSSGTDALLVAMMAMGIGLGDEVITTPFTFFATAGCISRLGAKPVFVDINPRSYNIDPDAIEAAVTPATKAIIPVHLYGLSAEMDPIMAVAARYGLKVIEDAAQAIGARYHGNMVCTIGDVGTLSFYPSKNLSGMGDGGAVITNNDDLADKIRQLRNHGYQPGTPCDYPMVGGNFRLDGLQAALLAVKVDHLDAYNDGRRSRADRYTRRLEDLALTPPQACRDCVHVYNQYTLRVLGEGRDALGAHLSALGVGNRIYYEKPLHLQPCYKHLGYKPGSLPEAELAAQEVVSIPCFPEMTQDEQDEVIHAIHEFFDGD